MSSLSDKRTKILIITAVVGIFALIATILGVYLFKQQEVTPGDTSASTESIPTEWRIREIWKDVNSKTSIEIFTPPKNFKGKVKVEALWGWSGTGCIIQLNESHELIIPGWNNKKLVMPDLGNSIDQAKCSKEIKELRDLGYSDAQIGPFVFPHVDNNNPKTWFSAVNNNEPASIVGDWSSSQGDFVVNLKFTGLEGPPEEWCGNGKPKASDLICNGSHKYRIRVIWNPVDTTPPTNTPKPTVISSPTPTNTPKPSLTPTGTIPPTNTPTLTVTPSSTATPVPKPSIEILKSEQADHSTAKDEQTVEKGGEAVFYITVTNTGDIDLKEVEVTDVLSPDCNKSIGSLVKGGAESYECRVTGVQVGFTNVAEVIGKSVDTDTEVRDSDPTEVKVKEPEYEPGEVSIKKVGAMTCQTDMTAVVKYKIEISNLTNGNMTLEIRDKLDDKITTNMMTTRLISDEGTYSKDTNEIVWSGWEIGAGEKKDITYEVEVGEDKYGDYVNTVVAKNEGTEIGRASHTIKVMCLPSTGVVTQNNMKLLVPIALMVIGITLIAFNGHVYLGRIIFGRKTSEWILDKNENN